MLLGKPQENDVTIGSADGPDPTAILGDCCRTTVIIREDHEFKSDVGMCFKSAIMQEIICSSYCIAFINTNYMQSSENVLILSISFA